MDLPSFILISTYHRYIFSWESSKWFYCVISWQLVPKQYGLAFPSKPVSLLHKLSGGFQQPLRRGGGCDFSFHLRSDWEDADAFSRKGETNFISLSDFVGEDGGSLWGWKSLSVLFFLSFFCLLLFLPAFEWTGSWGGKDSFVNGICWQKWDCFSQCLHWWTYERFLLHCRGIPFRWPVAPVGVGNCKEGAVQVAL